MTRIHYAKQLLNNKNLAIQANILVKMIENFVNTIGLDGEYYGSTCNCSIAWGRPKLDAEGEFITPKSDRLINLLNKSQIDQTTKNKIISRGLILVNSKYRFEEIDANLFVTLIHEMFHSFDCILFHLFCQFF